VRADLDYKLSFAAVRMTNASSEAEERLNCKFDDECDRAYRFLILVERHADELNEERRFFKSVQRDVALRFCEELKQVAKSSTDSSWIAQKCGEFTSSCCDHVEMFSERLTAILSKHEIERAAMD
jgi:hypothetical protein